MITTRFAPSPTGFMHIGGIRTALYNYAWAKKNKGKYLLRIEDTDTKRTVENGVKNILAMLKAYNLDPDNKGEIQEPDLGNIKINKQWIFEEEKLLLVNDNNYDNLYVQTSRIPLYQKYALKLLKENNAYICFCSEDRLKKLKEDQIKSKQIPRYDGFCKKFTYDEAIKKIKAGEEFVIRLNVENYIKKFNKSIIEHHDHILGTMKYPLKDVNDQVLIKANGIPTYHLAVVVDDHLMGITYPLRAWEWIASTPKQVMLYDMLGWEMPEFTHLTAILDPEGGKLSKRKGSVGAKDFLENGYLPEAILNFLMLLGWAPSDDREFFTLEEFVQEFSIEKLNKANPIFDRQKLLWFNGEYIRKLSDEDFDKKVRQWINDYYEDKSLSVKMISDKGLVKKLAIIKERVKTLAEIPDSLRFFYERLSIPDTSEIKGVKKYTKEQQEEILKEYIEILSNYSAKTDEWTQEVWFNDAKELSIKLNWKYADLFMLLRLIMCGSPISPPLFESMQILGKGEVIERIQKAVGN